MKISTDTRDVLIALLSIGDIIYCMTTYGFGAHSRDEVNVTARKIYEINKDYIRVTTGTIDLNGKKDQYIVFKKDLIIISEIPFDSTLTALLKQVYPNSLCTYFAELAQ